MAWLCRRIHSPAIKIGRWSCTLAPRPVNGSLCDAATVAVDYGEDATGPVEVTRFDAVDGDPFVAHDWDRDGFERETFAEPLSGGGTASVDLSPAGVAVLLLGAD